MLLALFSLEIKKNFIISFKFCFLYIFLEASLKTRIARDFEEREMVIEYNHGRNVFSKG